MYNAHKLTQLDPYLTNNLPKEFIDRYNYHNQNVRHRMKMMLGSSTSLFALTLKHFVGEGNVRVLKEVDNYVNIEESLAYLFNEACYHNRLDCLEYLYHKYSTIIVSEKILDNGLSDAARQGHLKTIDFLVECGANINAHDGDAFYQSISSKKLNVVNYLIKYRAEIHHKNYHSILSLSSQEPDIFKSVVEYGYQIEPLTFLQKKLLHSSSSKNKRRYQFFTNDNEYDSFNEAMEEVIDRLLKQKNIELLDFVLDKGGDDTLIKESLDPDIITWYTKRQNTLLLQQKLEKQLNQKDRFTFFKNISSFLFKVKQLSKQFFSNEQTSQDSSVEHKTDQHEQSKINIDKKSNADEKVIEIGMTPNQRRKI